MKHALAILLAFFLASAVFAQLAPGPVVQKGEGFPFIVDLNGDGVDDLVQYRTVILSDGTAPVEDKSKVLERGKLKMDPERHTCMWDNRPVTLTVTEFLILQALATRPGVVKTRDALMDAAYDDQVYVDDRTIDSHIKRLRKKFKAVDSSFDMIETLYGVGYRFKEA